MRTAFAILLTFGILMAGCTGPSAPADASSDPQEARLKRIQEQAAKDKTSYEHTFSLGDTPFENGLRRVRLTAIDDLAGTATLEASMGQFGRSEECIAASISVPEGVRVEQGKTMPKRDPPHVAAALFRIPFDPQHPRVRVQNERVNEYVGVGPPPYRGQELAFGEDVEFLLPKGKSILVELGGSSSRVIGDATVDVLLKLTGAVLVEDLPPAGLRCGASWYDSDTSLVDVEGGFSFVSVAAGARASLTTQHASTARLVFDELPVISGAGRLRFLDETIPFQTSITGLGAEVRVLHRNSTQAGTLAFEVEHWVSWVQGYQAWLLADANWPRIDMLVPNSH